MPQDVLRKDIAFILLLVPALLHTGATRTDTASQGTVQVEVSIGEMIDKWTILRIKEIMIKDPEKLKNVKTELQALDAPVKQFLKVAGVVANTQKLQEINQKLWKIEDDIREQEAKKDFGEKFKELARSVYFTNDDRCAVKRTINQACGSRIVEEKLLPDYRAEKPAPAEKQSAPATGLQQQRDLLTAAQRDINAHNKDAALQNLTALRQLDPENPIVLSMLGNVHQLSHNYQEASAYFAASLKHRPKDVETINQLCHALQTLGQFDSYKLLTEALYRMDPQSNKIKMLMVHLRDGEWQKCLEILDMSKQWNGEDLTGQTVIINLKYDVGSHGFGDAFQLLRLAKQLKQEAGARVILRLFGNPCLRTILSQAPYVTQVITEKDPLPPHDRQYTPSIAATMLDCARAPYKHRLMTPYMHVDRDLVEYWHNKLPKDGTFKVGLCWNRAHMKDFFSGKSIPCPRSMTNNDLAPLARIPGIRFYNLQKFTADEQFPTGLEVTHFGANFDKDRGAFMDTAALMKNLDLVITIDTSIAHLAGGLGVPVWTLLPASSDYRWLRNLDETMWYPTMRLFHQKSPHVWSDVIEQVCSELQKLTR